MATRDVNGMLLKTKPEITLDVLISYYMLSRKKVEKSSYESKHFRNLSEAAVKKALILTSLMFQNKSLCLATTEDLGSCYVARCENCFVFPAVAESIKNIEFSKGHKCPKSVISIAKNYEHVTTEYLQIETNTRANAYAKFEFERHTNTPHVVLHNSVIMKKGQLITTKDLRIGDIIAVEHPFFGASFKASTYMNCANCMKFAMFTLIPCDGCTTSNIYDFTFIS